MGMILSGMLVLLLVLDPPAVHQAGALAVVRATVYRDGVSFSDACLFLGSFLKTAYLVKVRLRAALAFAGSVHPGTPS
jgi:hypothetical protein